MWLFDTQVVLHFWAFFFAIELGTKKPYCIVIAIRLNGIPLAFEESY
jgi:hypothetical protein